MPRKYFLWGLFGLFMLSPMLVLFFLPMTAEDERRLVQLRKIASETPVYPGFEQLGSTEMAKITNALVSFSYRAPSDKGSYDEVKSFYARELPARGWGPPEEEHGITKFGFGPNRKRITFRKGELQVSIDYIEGSSGYSVGYSWEKW